MSEATACSVAGCDRLVRTRQLCNAHYQRLKTVGDVQADRPLRPKRPNVPHGTACRLDECERVVEAHGYCNRHYRQWLRRQHPERHRAKALAYQQRHREMYRRASRRWSKANPEYVRLNRQRRRALIRNAPVRDLTLAQWRDIKAAYRHRCAYCDKRCPLTMDHVIPLSRGGSHTASNVIPACQSCNSRKNDRSAPTHQPLLF